MLLKELTSKRKIFIRVKCAKCNRFNTMTARQDTDRTKNDVSVFIIKDFPERFYLGSGRGDTYKEAILEANTKVRSFFKRAREDFNPFLERIYISELYDLIVCEKHRALEKLRV